MARKGERHSFLCLLVGVALAGCSHIATVEPVTPRLAITGNEDPSIAAASNDARDAAKLERSDPRHALGEYLASAETALTKLDQRPDNEQARKLYNFSVARSIGVIETARLNPWQHAIDVPSSNSSYSLSGVRHAEKERDPSGYRLIPTDTFTVGGKYLEKRVTVEGIGAPVVVLGREKNADFRKTFSSHQLYGGATGIIRFRGHRALLEFFELFGPQKVSLGRHAYPLAADFTAPYAVGLTQESPQKLGLIRMLRPEKYNETARLTRLQRYDPNRIPVIFVHGLQDTPVSWTPMINSLREDPEIRERYQFWVYSYPSGYPFPYAAHLFREELDAVTRAFPDHKSVVLVGHSMGGLLSRLMVTNVGERMWVDYFGKPPGQTSIPPESKQLLVDSLVFKSRSDVGRVIFISTPHRGSELASNWIGRLATGLIKMPFLLASVPFEVIAASATSDPAAMQLKRLPNSIDTLAPNNRFVRELDKFPIAPGVPYHSIIGDRGRGNTPQSSDGVVPYWSSHLEGAQSELIVPSNHSALLNPQAIAEVQRILKLRR